MSLWSGAKRDKPGAGFYENHMFSYSVLPDNTAYLIRS
jgi:hypothetical protein